MDKVKRTERTTVRRTMRKNLLLKQLDDRAMGDTEIQASHRSVRIDYYLEGGVEGSYINEKWTGDWMALAREFLEVAGLPNELAPIVAKILKHLEKFQGGIFSIKKTDTGYSVVADEEGKRILSPDEVEALGEAGVVYLDVVFGGKPQGTQERNYTADKVEISSQEMDEEEVTGVRQVLRLLAKSKNKLLQKQWYDEGFPLGVWIRYTVKDPKTGKEEDNKFSDMVGDDDDWENTAASFLEEAGLPEEFGGVSIVNIIERAIRQQAYFTIQFDEAEGKFVVVEKDPDFELSDEEIQALGRVGLVEFSSTSETVGDRPFFSWEIEEFWEDLGGRR